MFKTEVTCHLVPESATGLLFETELVVHFFNQQNRYDAIFHIHPFTDLNPKDGVHKL